METICQLLDFNAPARWDSDGFFDVTQPTRITIPTDLGGRYVAHATVMWYFIAGPPFDMFTLAHRDSPNNKFGYFTAEITVNGDRPDPRENLCTDAVIPGTVRNAQNVLWETNLDAEDYLELYLCQTVLGNDPSILPENEDLRVEVNFKLRRLGVAG
jgi:hypothetical protein